MVLKNKPPSRQNWEQRAADAKAAWEAERDAAMQSPETAFRYLIDERNFAADHADEFWDLIKQCREIYYDEGKAAGRIATDYLENPEATLERLVTNPKHYGRLAHKDTLDDPETSVAEFLQDQLVAVTNMMRAEADANRELASLKAQHPDLGDRMEAEAAARTEKAVQNLRAMCGLDQEQPAPSWSEQLAREEGIEPAQPRSDPSRSRSR
jgi:hypothetical protein